MNKEEIAQLTESVKKISIQRYFDKVIVPSMGAYYDTPVDFEARPVCKCPLHDENTASFRYYPDSNSFFCYGCDVGGDIITLHREFQKKHNDKGATFIEALQFLDNLGGDRENFDTVKITSLTDIESSVTDYTLFALAIRRMEDYAKDLVMEKRIMLYSKIDDLDNAVKFKRLNAREAKTYLEDYFERLRKGEK